MFADAEGAGQCGHESCFLRSADWTRKVRRKVVQELADNFVWVVKIDEEIVGLRQIIICQLGYYHHLRLLESASQIEIVQVFIEGEEGDARAFTTRQSSLLKDSFDRGRSLGEIARVDRLLRHVQQE